MFQSKSFRDSNFIQNRNKLRIFVFWQKKMTKHKRASSNSREICSILFFEPESARSYFLKPQYKCCKSNTLQLKKLKKGYCPSCCHRFIKNNCTNGRGRLPPFHGNKSLFRNYKHTWPIFIRNLRIALCRKARIVV